MGRVSHKTKFLYGIGAFGYGSIGQTINSFGMFFGTGVLGIPGTLMGLAIGISTIWDATTDPFVGHFSDRTKSRFFGKRHGWIIFAAILVAIFNLMLWSVPMNLSTMGKFWLLLIVLLLLETFNTCYSTPYGALGLDLSQNYDDRTAVQNYRTAFSFSSLLVPSILMIFFLQDPRNIAGYRSIALITSILCIVCAAICFAGTYKHRSIKQDNPEEKKSRAKISDVFEGFFGIVRQKNVGLLIAGYAISLSAGAFITSLGLHVFTFTFGFSTMQIPIIMVCLIAGIIIAQPLWYFVSRHTDKIVALIMALGMLLICMALFASILVFRGFLPPDVALVLISLVIFLSGIGTGCLYSMPISMFADCIARHQEQTGTDNTGKCAGFLTFSTKTSNAFILFIIGLSLDIIGFNGANAEQTQSVQNWLGWLLIAGVVIAATSAMLIYSNYSYTREELNPAESNTMNKS